MRAEEELTIYKKINRKFQEGVRTPDGAMKKKLILKSEKEHLCAACKRNIPPGSRLIKYTQWVVKPDPDGKFRKPLKEEPQFFYTHINDDCDKNPKGEAKTPPAAEQIELFDK